MRRKIGLLFLSLLLLSGGYCLYQSRVAWEAEQAYSASAKTSYNLTLLARLINGESRGEPFTGQVAVGGVILNRVQHPRFPHSVASVIFQPGAFESVSRGQIWKPVTSASWRAARSALSGWDPSYGSLYFWNPAKPVNPWMWTRRIVTRIGRHVFAK